MLNIEKSVLKEVIRGQQDICQKSGRDWLIIGWLLCVHIGAVAAFWHVSLAGLVSAGILYFLTGCVGITFGFHRMMTHRAFRAHPMVEAIAALCGTWAMQGTVIEWVSTHRLHHRRSDTDVDPHNACAGFWYSHMRWLFKRHDPKVFNPFMHEIAADVRQRWVLRALSTPGAMAAAQIALALFLWWIGGLSGVLWGIFFRLALVYHVTWLVNSATHRWGYRTFASNDLARNNWFVALVAWGEGWHNNHHRFPWVAPAGLQWWEFDVTYGLIRLLKVFGLVSEVKGYPAGVSCLRDKTPTHVIGKNELGDCLRS